MTEDQIAEFAQRMWKKFVHSNFSGTAAFELTNTVLKEKLRDPDGITE